jgi:hypothetical protein
MIHMHNTDGRAASCTRLTNGLVNKEGKWLLPSGRGVQRKISRGVKPLAGWVAMCALLFSLCIPVQGGLLKADVDFSKACSSSRSISRKISTDLCTPRNGIAMASIILSQTHLRTASSIASQSALGLDMRPAGLESATL